MAIGFYQGDDKLNLSKINNEVNEIFKDKNPTGDQTCTTDISPLTKSLTINYTESITTFNFGEVKIWKDGTTGETTSFDFKDSDFKDQGSVSVNIEGNCWSKPSNYYIDNKRIYYNVTKENPKWTDYNYEIDYELPEIVGLMSYGFDPNYKAIYGDEYDITFSNEESILSGYEVNEVNFNDKSIITRPTFAQFTWNQTGKLSGKFKNNYDNQSKLNLTAESRPLPGGIWIPNSHYYHEYTNITNNSFTINFDLYSTEKVTENGESVLTNHTDVNYLKEGVSSYINLSIIWQWGKTVKEIAEFSIPSKTESKYIGDEIKHATIDSSSPNAILWKISTTPYKYNSSTGEWEEIKTTNLVRNARINVQVDFVLGGAAGEYPIKIDVLASTQRS